MKHDFTDSICMERLISVLVGEPKKCINAFGTNGIFYVNALLKEQFCNPYLVSCYILKILFDLLLLLENDHIGLRCYIQTTESYLNLVALNAIYFCTKINRNRN